MESRSEQLISRAADFPAGPKTLDAAIERMFSPSVCPNRSELDQTGCFCAGSVFRARSRANLSALNRAVFSRVAKRAASYSAIAV